jgi:hypothetical protein
MAAVSNMPEMIWQEVTVRARHRVSLEPTFCHQKAASKPLKDAFYAILVRKIKNFPRSDPALVTINSSLVPIIPIAYCLLPIRLKTGRVTLGSQIPRGLKQGIRKNSHRNICAS